MVSELVEAESVPVRMACDIAGLPTSSWYYVGVPKGNSEDLVIEEFLRVCAARRPRRGFWKCYKLARRKGHIWNHKRVYRVYKQLGLHLRRRVKCGPPACVQQPLLAPEAPNVGWAMDFTRNTLTTGRVFHTLNLIDEFNREVLAIEIDLSLPAERVIRVLEQVKVWRCLPISIRVDNGPEFIADALAEWGRGNGVVLNFIPPSKPQKNGFVERFNGSFREDVLDCYLFDTLDEVRDAAWEWMLEYNEEIPHDSLGDLTPQEIRSRSVRGFYDLVSS